MLLLNSTESCTVAGYSIAYTITQDTCNYGDSTLLEYGINCILFGKGRKRVSSEEVRCITPDFTKISEIVRILKKHKVFPIHLREIICDLLEQF
ncbi:MAG: DUF6514 family protein [Lachnospiraceae bacterium]